MEAVAVVEQGMIISPSSEAKEELMAETVAMEDHLVMQLLEVPVQIQSA